MVEGFFLRHARSALVTLQRDFFLTLYRLATCFFFNQLTDRIPIIKVDEKGTIVHFCFFCIEIIWF